MQNLLGIFLVVCIASSGLRSGLAFKTVMDYGAVGDGLSDDSEAFMKAWEDLCGAAEDSNTLIIPMGKTFLVNPVMFQGPCKSTSIHVQVLGNIVAPNTMTAWTGCYADAWLYFSDVDGLIMDGSGEIDGRGSIWWNEARESYYYINKLNTLFSGGEGEVQATNAYLDHIFVKEVTHEGGYIYGIIYGFTEKVFGALHFHNCSNLQLSGLKHLNSPRNHITINFCNGVTISNLHIIAPEDSPNTDGIDISLSSQVYIHDSFIGTGDDCVAINGGSSYINITRVTCGPGHGISVGSLGENGAHETVEEVYVQNCTFNGTQNGARIKTWPGGSGYARKISFEQIILISTENPIIIDQNYCNGQHGCQNKSSSAVEVSSVTYSGVQGSSASKEAISLNCSENVACTNIVMDQIYITSSLPGEETSAYCKNAHGTAQSSTPNVPCLS